ncbi:hypothetical protein EXIGLDRAFT_576533, partial [Exidia glandulosa HHB12029]
LEGLEEEEADAEEEQSAEADDADGWVDELEEMGEAERFIHEDDIRPVRLALIKLRRLASKVLHSTTKLCPRWKELCEAHKIALLTMPRDVRTRWNSTFDMLEMALRYRPVIDSITSQRDLGL